MEFLPQPFNCTRTSNTLDKFFMNPCSNVICTAFATGICIQRWKESPTVVLRNSKRWESPSWTILGIQVDASILQVLEQRSVQTGL